MNLLPRIKSLQDFHEIDKDQGVERIYSYYKSGSSMLHTEKQEVNIIESPTWGTMLFLDGTLQSTTRDEIIYHNALVHPLMYCLNSIKNILILGGGEGATAREVLRWPVQSLTMVDYDKALVEHMKIHGSKWSQGAFNDPRLEIIYRDAWIHLQSAVHYDGVIIDLVDPGSSIHKWSKLLSMVLASVKRSRGAFVMNAGLYLPWKLGELKEVNQMLYELCNANPDYTYTMYTSFIPSFNGEWTFIIVHPIDAHLVPIDNISVIPAWIRRTMKPLSSEMLINNVDTTPSTSKLYVLP